jgi:hypothetical protein
MTGDLRAPKDECRVVNHCSMKPITLIQSNPIPISAAWQALQPLDSQCATYSSPKRCEQRHANIAPEGP